VGDVPDPRSGDVFDRLSSATGASRSVRSRIVVSEEIG